MKFGLTFTKNDLTLVEINSIILILAWTRVKLYRSTTETTVISCSVCTVQTFIAKDVIKVLIQDGHSIE